MHVFALHKYDSGQPLRALVDANRMPFHPYLTFKDLATAFVFLLTLSLIAWIKLSVFSLLVQKEYNLVIQTSNQDRENFPAFWLFVRVMAWIYGTLETNQAFRVKETLNQWLSIFKVCRKSLQCLAIKLIKAPRTRNLALNKCEAWSSSTDPFSVGQLISMCNIPGDVIQLIIDESVPPASFDTWSVRAETLLSLCRVNRAWVQVARRELYRCPLISGKGVQFLSAASKTGRWAQAREIRFLDVDFGKRAVNNVLSRSSGTLNHIWIANCEKVDLSRIAKAQSESQAPYWDLGKVIPLLRAYPIQISFPSTFTTALSRAPLLKLLDVREVHRTWSSHTRSRNSVNCASPSSKVYLCWARFTWTRLTLASWCLYPRRIVLD